MVINFNLSYYELKNSTYKSQKTIPLGWHLRSKASQKPRTKSCKL